MHLASVRLISNPPLARSSTTSPRVRCAHPTAHTLRKCTHSNARTVAQANYKTLAAANEPEPEPERMRNAYRCKRRRWGGIHDSRDKSFREPCVFNCLLHPIRRKTLASFSRSPRCFPFLCQRCTPRCFLRPPQEIPSFLWPVLGSMGVRTPFSDYRFVSATLPPPFHLLAHCHWP